MREEGRKREAQLMGPGIGQNKSCVLGNILCIHT